MADTKRVPKDLPKALREELRGSKYAPRTNSDIAASKPFDDSVERALYNEMLGKKGTLSLKYTAPCLLTYSSDLNMSETTQLPC